MVLRPILYRTNKRHNTCPARLLARMAACLMLVCAGGLRAETVAIGQVLDERDRLPLASVNVYFKNTSDGTATNAEGYFLLRTDTDEERLVFSAVGYRTEEVKIKPGQSAFITVEMQEQSTLLDELFVLPGSNPALDWMKRLRLMRKANDVTLRPDYRAQGVAQSLVVLSRTDDGRTNRRLFDQLRTGDLSPDDPTLTVPLYMAESELSITNKGREETARRLFTTSEKTDRLVMQLTDGLNPELNFYRNAVTVLGKSMVSPLANIGNSYYNYYLTDSLYTDSGKQYVIRFRSRNPKNLAFDGTLRFDSATLALTYIEAELPRQANLNYVHGLRVRQQFDTLPGRLWVQRTGELTIGMSYTLPGDTLPRPSELLLRQSLSLDTRSVPTLARDSFARSEYSVETLEERMQTMEDTPFMRVAKWVADAALTSYARAGFIDFGPLQQTLRLTDIEGLRVVVPLRTNERLWKNASIGGYAGYAFRDRSVPWSAFGRLRLPLPRRNVLELRYTDDYRRIDYNYNNYLRREDPWDLADEDIVSTLLSLQSGRRLSRRHEWSLSYARDWTRDIESTLSLRRNTLLPNTCMPMTQNGVATGNLRQHALAWTTRFSFGERKYDDHLTRMYIQNEKPVIYATAEAGHYAVGNREGYYGKFIASMRHKVNTAIGTWRYALEAGCVLGQVPYPLLEFSPGVEPNGIAFYQFNRMRYMEFGHDKYVQATTEFVFNGLVFNHIPYIKHLGIREFVGLKAVAGGLNSHHREVLDFPDLPAYLRPMTVPYVEGTVGITNLLGLFAVQFNYRFTNHYNDIDPGGFSFGLRFGF